jgi:nucleoside-diphosphate-sugar epimerase
VRDRTPGIEAIRHRDIVVATDKVLAAVAPSTHLVVASSSSVYGGARLVDGRRRPSREDDALAPRGGYAAAKARMEARVQARMRDGGLTTIVRPFTVIGEGQRPDMALSLWLDAALAGRPLQVLGSLDRTRDLTDVRVVAQCLLAVLDQRVQGVLNLGTGRATTLDEMVQAVREVTRTQAAVDVRPAPDVDVAATLADTTRTRRLGVDLTTDLLDCVQRQLDAHLVAARR